MWCWWQHLGEAVTWDLLHVDRHFDTASAEPEMAHVPPVTAPLAAYLNAEFPWFAEWHPAIRWDNYLWLFLKRHGEQGPVGRASRLSALPGCLGVRRLNSPLIRELLEPRR